MVGMVDSSRILWAAARVERHGAGSDVVSLVNSFVSMSLRTAHRTDPRALAFQFDEMD